MGNSSRASLFTYIYIYIYILRFTPLPRLLRVTLDLELSFGSVFSKGRQLISCYPVIDLKAVGLEETPTY